MDSWGIGVIRPLYRPGHQKTQLIGHQSESISDQGQNEPGQRMEDILPGITAKNFYQKPNPRFKTHFKENLKYFIDRETSTSTIEANWSL